MHVQVPLRKSTHPKGACYHAEYPGSSGREVCRGVEIGSDSRTYEVLHNLQRKGLLAKAPNGTKRAWSVTAQGHELLQDLPEGVYDRPSPAGGGPRLPQPHPLTEEYRQS